MTPTAATTAAEPDLVDTGAPAPLTLDHGRRVGEAAGILGFGTLFWLGPLWLLGIVGNLVAAWAVARWTTMDLSLWDQGFAGWQLWVLGAGGATAVTMLLPALVASGANRAVVSHAGIIVGAALGILGAAVVTVGLMVEGAWYRRQGWPHVVGDSERTAAEIGYPTVLLGYAVVLTFAYLFGWLLFATWQRFGPSGVVLLPLELLLLVGVAYGVGHPSGVGPFDVLERFSAPNLWVGVPIALVALAVTAFAADHLTRGIDFD